MKQLIVALCLVVVSLSFAQRPDTFGASVQPSLPGKSRPIELRITENNWNGPDSPYTNLVIEAIFAEWASKHQLPLASNTAAILEEGWQRDQLIKSIWVNHGSERFQPETLVAPEVTWEIVVGGRAERPRQVGGQLGPFSASVETGSAEMIVSVKVKNLVTGLSTTVIGRGRHSSTNLTAAQADIQFHRSWIPVGWSGWQGSSETRREMIASIRALDDVLAQLQTFYGQK